MLPYVVLHNSLSIDGRITGFTPDLEVHYKLASHWDIDAHLAGSNTIFNPDDELPEEDEQVFEVSDKDPEDQRSLLVVPDSRGRVRNWHVLRKAPFWRDMLALCSSTTPETYLEYLTQRHIEYIIAGDDHVDMREALEILNTKFGIKTVLLDSGGILNGVLLRAGLVNELSLLVHPILVGGER